MLSLEESVFASKSNRIAIFPQTISVQTHSTAKVVPVPKNADFYVGCGDTKGCFGLPTLECIYEQNCELFVSFQKDFNFQLSGKVAETGDSYVAVGLSFDESMGQDSVIACIRKDGVVESRSYYNVPGQKNNLPMNVI
jgi:hypothetical protein